MPENYGMAAENSSEHFQSMLDLMRRVITGNCRIGWSTSERKASTF
jgi:hypothetical protein